MITFRRRRDTDRAREFRNLAERLKRERSDASRTVEPLLKKTPRSDWPALAEAAELQTAGALERLANLFADSLTKDPKHAHAIAELAVAVAEGMPESTYPPVVLAQLRAHAWKDLGKGLRFLGRNDEAIKQFEAAEALVHNHPSLAHDRAIVWFNLAMSLQEVDRFEDSQGLLSESKRIFRNHGDTRNTILCGVAEGVLLQRLRRYREARETYLLLFASARDIDTESMAAIHHAVGFCSIELADFAEAETNLERAIQLYREVKQPAVILKVELGRGRLFIRRGDHTAGVGHLRRIRHEFLKHAMHEEAGICGLEMVEGLLLLNRPADAETLAKTIVSEFTLAGLNKRAITALGYLSEAIEARRAAPALVTEVREYILSLQTRPEREFQPTA